MTLLLATVPILLLLALFWLDIYVFRGQWKDEPQESDGAQEAPAPGSPNEPAKARHHKAGMF